MMNSLGMLWIFGSAAVLLGIGTKLFGSLPVESYETAQYLWVSLGVPAVALALGLSKRTKIAKLVLLAAFMVFTAYYTMKASTLPLIGFALAQLAVTAVFLRKQVKFSLDLIPVGALSLLAWVLASKMIWWRAPAEWSSEASGVWYLIAGTAALVGFGMWPASSTLSRFEPPRILTRVLDVLAVSFFLLPSIRMNFQSYHTGFYVGPANLVRDGGWLLWDVPSQYGFLNILLMAILPGVSSWQAFWIIDATLLFLSAGITYVLLRNLMSGARGIPAAFLATLASVFFLPGWVPELTGPTAYPSGGALRFFFPYALMAFVFFNLKRNGARFWSQSMLALGNFIWLLGVLWALESAIYCTMIWGAILFSVAWGRGLKSWLKIILTPPALLLAAWGVIAVYYKLNLGFFPDPIGYLDFALTYQSGFGSLPVDPNGSMWLLILMLSGVAYAAYLVIRRAPWLSVGIIGAGAMLVATATYFVARSHENNISILFPLFLVGIVTALVHVESIPELRPSTWLVRFALVPILSIVFVLPLTPSVARQWWNDISSPRGLASVHDAIPPVPEAVRTLFDRARLRPNDPVTSLTVEIIGSSAVASEAHRSPSPYRDWLPLAPAQEIDVLDTPTQTLYLDRFMTRAPSGGWILTTNPLSTFNAKLPTIANVAFTRLSKSHDIVERFEEGNWVLLRYERKKAE